MVVSVILAATLGVLGAWAASLAADSGRIGRITSRFFVVSMLAAIATPMILHAAAWEATAGKFGWMALTQTGARTWFKGLIACGWIHGLVGTAMIGLAVWHGAQTVPKAILAQASLELGPSAIWWKVRLRHAMPWLMVSALATAMLAATEMTVVDLYGFRTVADEFYLFYSTNPTTISVLQTLCIPMAIGIAGLVIFWLADRRSKPVRTTHGDVAGIEKPSRVLGTTAALIACGIALTVIVVPIAGLLVKVGHQVDVVDAKRIASWSKSRGLTTLIAAPKSFQSEYGWTIAIFVCVSVVAVFVGWIAASLGRTRGRCEVVIDVACVCMFLLPGPIVGLAVVHFFQMPIPGFRDLYHKSLVPTIVALMFRAGPVAYWIIRSGYRGIDDAIINTAKIELSYVRQIWSVHRPLIKRSLITAAIASGVVASGDVPATLPVVPAGVTTVGTRLFGLLHSGARFQEAALALWYVAAIVALTLVWSKIVGKQRGRME